MSKENSKAGNVGDDGAISRREFIQKSAVLTASLAAGTTLVDALGPAASHANQVDPNDAALTSADVKFSSADGASINAYITRPKGDGKRPAIIVIHDNGALDDHNRDIGRRLAKAGYVAIVPDLISRQGSTRSFPNPAAVAKAISKTDQEEVIKDLTAAANYVKGQSFAQASKVGVVGFCWGGAHSLLFTTRNKDLAAAVVYYGRNPSKLDDVQNITAPLLAHYGELDKPITSEVPKLEEAMKKYRKSFEYKIYADSPHAFNSDTRPDRYRPEAAKEAWGRTLEFFKKHLQG
ncbi:MAG: dienelactone hydrolase family protein [Deltaproteobacteria bacterium]|nr:dienelactone hydrolase family protein [Deltaproteobacteria bacterium]